MGKTTTKFVNNTTIPFVLKEGNAGVYTPICTLATKAPENQHSIAMDLNATYREYVVATSAEGHKILVTSDDCAEYSTINIVKDDKENKYVFEGDKRPDPKGFWPFSWLGFWNRRPPPEVSARNTS